jgi:ABC-type phosphate transport system ATPase subunit
MPITLDTILIVGNGARFYTADLHVHSFGGSTDVSDSSMTVEAVIDAAVTQAVSILAFADHNTDANVSRAVEYAARYAGQLLVLPAAEITTAHGHLLVYFAPDQSHRLRDLLGRIELVGIPGTRDTHTAMSMAGVVAQVERLGGVAVAAHIDRAKTGFEAIAPGYPSWKRDILCAPALYGLEFDAHDHLMWFSPDDEPTADGAERKKLLAARAQQPSTSARFRLAAVQNSDAHTLADFAGQQLSRTLTRFKLDELTFDGFRTALTDCEARVRALQTVPVSVPRILGMQISGGFLDNAAVHFSPNLSCLIGGRGTGKSTAVRSLAYGLGVDNEIAAYDNCPDNVVIYGEDAAGVRYRYERIRGQEPTVRAKDDQSIKDVPADAFRVEFYGQGALAEVAKNPLRNAALLQSFLDRHLTLSDLVERERLLVEELRQNSAQLIPLEASAGQLPSKTVLLEQLNKKLQIAEMGKVREIVAFQSSLAAEKNLATSLGAVKALYERGMSLTQWVRDYDQLARSVGTLTGHKDAAPWLAKAKITIDKVNAFLKTHQQDANTKLRDLARELGEAVARLQQQHQIFDQALNEKIVDLQKKGLAASIKALNELVQGRTAVTTEIARVSEQQPQLAELRSTRTSLLAELSAVRAEMLARRKSQLAPINMNLRRTIDDYSVYLYYDDSGIIDSFKALLTNTMHGSYFQDETAATFCFHTTPRQLADRVRADDITSIAGIAGVGDTWAQEIVKRFKILSTLHELEVCDKSPKPIVKVLTKTTPQKEIPVNQLSDGQKHTILLTIAMLAESNLPLIMDQPEDDLDNAFIFKSVVATLRFIKERRQIILVTHNANIAVLGDSELILPMKRSGDAGVILERGSIDRPETKKAVQEILEGGELAFQRRSAIYGYS